MLSDREELDNTSRESSNYSKKGFDSKAMSPDTNTATLSITSGPTKSKWNTNRSKPSSKVSKKEKKRMRALKEEKAHGCCSSKPKRVPFDDEGNPILAYPSNKPVLKGIDCSKLPIQGVPLISFVPKTLSSGKDMSDELWQKFSKMIIFHANCTSGD